MNRQEIFEQVAEVIAERLGCDPEGIHMDTRFQDLKMDSLDTVALIMELEDRIEKEVDVDFEKGIKTVEDVVNFVEKSL